MSGDRKQLTKERLLALASSGVFTKFSPGELSDLYEDISHFFLINIGILNETEFYDLNELQFYVALMTNHDIQAKVCLDRLVDRFSLEKSQRIKILKSIYSEAQGDNEAATKILGQNKDEVNLSRRLVTFSRITQNNADYIASLIFYLDLQPADSVAWAELANEYKINGNYLESIFCWQKVLLQDPHAYKIFYEVGLLYYYTFLREAESNQKHLKKDKLLEIQDLMLNSRNNYLRCVELCDTHTRGWLGLHLLCTHQFLDLLLSRFSDEATQKFVSQNEELRKLTTRKLAAQRSSENEKYIDRFL